MASARTATVTVWVPALPPIEATIGISTASATIFSMAPSNWPITKEASTAVARFTVSHTARSRAVRTGLACMSSMPTPPIFKRSSSASSSITSTTSSTMITPRSRPRSSTTGQDTRFLSRNRWATSAWSAVAGTEGMSGSTMSRIGTGRLLRSMRPSGTEPRRRPAGSTTKMS